MKVLIVGLPLFADRLAKDLRAFDPDNNYISCDTYYSFWGKLKYAFHLSSADLVHSINGTNSGSKAFEMALKKNKKLMMHWVGTDVLLSTENFKNNKVNLEFVDKGHHYCEPQWLKDELVPIGIEAKLLMFRAYETDPGYKRPKPTSFSVLSYIGNNREVFYGFDKILKLADDFPEITFNCIGTSEKDYSIPNNVNMLGWVDNMQELYEQNVIYIRLTQHDGLATSIMEAVSFGCHAMWTFNFPHVHHVPDYEGLKEQFQSLYDKFEKGELEANSPGIEYMRETFDKSNVFQALIGTYKQILNES